MSSVSKSVRIPRVIPVLLLKSGGLTKTEGFGEGKYVGDPVNAVRIFNEKQVDEIAILDIEASAHKKEPNLRFIQDIASEAFMPLAYGGGITSMGQIETLIANGIEKVYLNSVCFTNPNLIKEAAATFGSQSIIASIDVKKVLIGGYKVFSHSGTHPQAVKLVDHLRQVEEMGAGEIVINSIDRDGQMKGYDLPLIELASKAVKVPVVALGGAGTVTDLRKAIQAGASAVAAGSLFVFFGKHRAVLITYPSREELKSLFSLKEQV